MNRLYHLRWLLPVAWMVVIFLLSHEVAVESTARSDVIVSVLHGVGLDSATEFVTVLVRKSAHFLAYAVLGGMFYWVLQGYGLQMHKAIVISLALAAVYAISDEVHQTFIAGRSGEVGDVLIDTLGALAGIGVVAVARHIVSAGGVVGESDCLT